jgi:hypothetical protein
LIAWTASVTPATITSPRFWSGDHSTFCGADEAIWLLLIVANPATLNARMDLNIDTFR